jgi:branched-chain amino acid transport system ATP-binding protein
MNTTSQTDPQTPILDASHIKSGYGQAVVVHDASVNVFPGEIVTIIGPNGSGKSTFLKAIFGLLPVFDGDLQFKGKDVSKYKPSQMVASGAAFVPQTDNVFVSLSIIENLQMGAFIRQTGVKKRADEILALFPELERRPHEKAANLSGGQRQSLALGRAMMLSPQLMILDEPTAALAPKVITEIFNQIKRIRNSGVAILMVEQNAEYALNVSDRGYVMVDGKTILTEPAQAMLQNAEVGKLFLGH